MALTDPPAEHHPEPSALTPASATAHDADLPGATIDGSNEYQSTAHILDDVAYDGPDEVLLRPGRHAS